MIDPLPCCSSRYSLSAATPSIGERTARRGDCDYRILRLSLARQVNPLEIQSLGRVCLAQVKLAPNAGEVRTAIHDGVRIGDLMERYPIKHVSDGQRQDADHREMITV